MAAHAEAGQEGESQQGEESGHHLVCVVRVGDQVSSHNVDSGRGQLEAGAGVRAGQQRGLAAPGGGLRGLQLPQLGSAGSQGLHGQVAACHQIPDLLSAVTIPDVAPPANICNLVIITLQKPRQRAVQYFGPNEAIVY